MKPGQFISFEGGEGSGKSTQLNLLARALEEVGVDVQTTREPGGIEAAEDIRALLLEGDPGRWLPVSEALLHSAARAEHVDGVIRPAIESGTWVLCDRFADSTRAYQGAGHGVPTETIETLVQIATGGVQPDLTIILDIGVEEGLARAFSRFGEEDRYEAMDVDFHRRIRTAFLEIAEREPIRCVALDASRDMEAIQVDVKRIVADRFGIALS